MLATGKDSMVRLQGGGAVHERTGTLSVAAPSQRKGNILAGCVRGPAGTSRPAHGHGRGCPES
jgi:hypothetical protein